MADKEKAQVMVAVEGCVVDWEKEVQRHPGTGEEYDFHGKKIEKKGKTTVHLPGKPKPEWTRDEQAKIEAAANPDQFAKLDAPDFPNMGSNKPSGKH